MNEIVLRPYQKDFIDNVRNEFKLNHRHVVGVAPCGAGKTIMTGWMIRETAKNGKRAIFFVHRRELIEQTAATFDQLDIPYGIIASGVKPNYDAPVQIASVQTLVKRLEYIAPPDLLVCDECHHILAKTYKKVIDYYKNAFLLGVTATPERTGKQKYLGDIFSSMVFAPSVTELIKLHNLTNFEYVSTKMSKDIYITLDDIDIVNGDYDNKQLGKVMTKKKIIGDVVENYLKYAKGKTAICYCVNVEHSIRVAEEFNNAGIAAKHCDGKTHRLEREEIVEDFRRGKYKILCNAELFGEGFDVPNCHAVILARPTKSLTLHIQQSMRSMRPDPNDPNKVAIIIDCVGDYKEHGYPDTIHDWALLPNPPKVEIKNKLPTKKCPLCGADDIPLGIYECPYCGYVFKNQNVQEEVIGELSTIHTSKDNLKNYHFIQTTQYAPRTIEDFLKIAGRKGYKKGWAVHRALEYATTRKDIEHISRVMGYKDGWAYYRFKELQEKNLQKNPSTVTI